jgi:hypothetical protein
MISNVLYRMGVNYQYEQQLEGEIERGKVSKRRADKQAQHAFPERESRATSSPLSSSSSQSRAHRVTSSPRASPAPWEPERLNFMDECGTHTSLSSIFGYAPRDERLYLPVPRTRGKNTTLLSSMTTGGMGPSLAGEGATNARVFETCVEKVLLPILEPGQIVVMDNLGAHRPKRIRELVEQQGCKLLYLPAYSPDYNPIDQACAKI